MNRQLPPALFAAIIIICTFGIIGLLTQLSPRSTLAGQRIENGPAFPDFSGKTNTGETFRLSDHKGKVILVNLWATWCGPCVVEMPDLVKLQEKYGPQGFQIVGVSADDTLELATEFAKEHKLNYPVLLAPMEAAQAISELGGNGLPTSVLINKEGKIVWHMTGVSEAVPPYEVISNELKRLL